MFINRFPLLCKEMAALEMALYSRRKGTLQTALYPHLHIFLSVSYNWKLCFPSCVWGLGREWEGVEQREQGQRDRLQMAQGRREQNFSCFLLQSSQYCKNCPTVFGLHDGALGQPHRPTWLWWPLSVTLKLVVLINIALMCCENWIF